MAQFASIPSMKGNPFSSYFEQFSKSPFQSLQGNHMESFIELNNITTQLCSKLMSLNLKMMSELVQCGVEELQELSQTKGDLIEACHVLNRTAAKSSPTVIQNAHEVLDTLLNASADYNRLLENNIMQATKTAAKWTQDKSYTEKNTEKR